MNRKYQTFRAERLELGSLDPPSSVPRPSSSVLRPSSILRLVLLLLLLATSQAFAIVTLGVNSGAVRFSPANWSGGAERGGGVSRVTWNNGAWCEWRWTTPADHPAAELEITNRTPGSAISYFVDGTLVDDVSVPAAGSIPIQSLSGSGRHSLIVYTRNSQQRARWSDENAFVVSGLMVDDGATALPAPARRPWVFIVGDSITEGILAANGADSNLADYSFLVGQGLRAAGYDYSVSACGYSGWIRPGDAAGDVPAYFAVHDGKYVERESRWDKIDARTSLLDARHHLSGYGGKGEEPAAIVINYMANEALSGANLADTRESVMGCLAALRHAAPNAWILVLMPPGLYDTHVYRRGPAYVSVLKNGVGNYHAAHRSDRKTVLIDLGPAVAHAIASPLYGGGVHPNAAGHAFLAPLVLQAILRCIR
ncbi:MAG TPA: SGNH/GDSL hydrolase family protein [Armatimonadota bacterium]|nr:SGNH/GDSL hydrolase family protein [Armatimonadota bacterium]